MRLSLRPVLTGGPLLCSGYEQANVLPIWRGRSPASNGLVACNRDHAGARRQGLRHAPTGRNRRPVSHPSGGTFWPAARLGADAVELVLRKTRCVRR